MDQMTEFSLEYFLEEELDYLEHDNEIMEKINEALKQKTNIKLELEESDRHNDILTIYGELTNKLKKNLKDLLIVYKNELVLKENGEIDYLVVGFMKNNGSYFTGVKTSIRDCLENSSRDEIFEINCSKIDSEHDGYCPPEKIKKLFGEEFYSEFIEYFLDENKLKLINAINRVY